MPPTQDTIVALSDAHLRRRPTADGATYTITAYLYDADGRLVAEIANCTESGTSPRGDPAWRTCSGTGTPDWQTNIVTGYAYDERGNRTKVTAPDPSADPASGATVVTRYAFDAEGRLCRVLAHATISDAAWDALADVCSTAIGGSATENVSTRYTYDGAGSLATMIDAAGHMTSYGYDETGRQTTVTDALGRTVTTAYDALGRPVSRTDRMGQVVAWAYDAAGRVLSRTAGGATTSYSYDDAGNRLTAADAARTITTTYDRLNRPLTVTTSDDAGAATSYSYSLTSPSWTDPTGTYLVTLDKFDRQASLDDPATTGTWAFAYRADGQPAQVTPPFGPATSYGYDNGGHLITKTTGSVAAFSYTLNRAGVRRSETATVSGDPKSGQTAFTYDALSRLTGYTPPGSGQTAYGWAAVPNRTSVTPPGGPTVSTAFDAADRPVSSGYASDLDGRITAIPALQGRPAMTLAYDALGRLVTVTAAGVATTYAYDPLDRLRSVSRGGSPVRRFRYVGQTGTVAQLLDGAGAVVRSVGTDWAGARLSDWTGTGQNLRYLGTNGHGDLVYTLDSSGAVTAASRLDPWGVPLSTVPAGFPEFRFQGSWADPVTELAWAISRWYLPTLGTFTSEDPLAGDPIDPPSRHLYAYGAGDPVDRADVSGFGWYEVRRGDSLASIAWRYLGRESAWPIIRWANYPRIASDYVIYPGDCLWLPRWVESWRQCTPPTGSRPWPYWRSKMMTRYMAQEMTNNCNYACRRYGFWDPRNAWTNLILMANFGWKVRPNGPWDHKPKLRYLTQSYEDRFFTPVRGLAAAIDYDIWSNIHYGYVGRAMMIPRDVLLLAQTTPGDSSDDAAVRLGMYLKEHNDICAITEDELRQAVVAWKAEFKEAGKLRSTAIYKY